VASSYDTIPDFGLLYDSVPLYAARQDIGFYVDEAKATRGNVLEVGCGTGRILLPIARAGSTITGIDGSKQMLERCRANLSAQPAAVQRRVNLVLNEMRTFDLGATYSLIIAPFRVVQHLTTIDDQLRFLAIVARHLARRDASSSTSSIRASTSSSARMGWSARIRPSSGLPTDARSGARTASCACAGWIR